MKLVRLLLVLLGVWCLADTYGMEKYNKPISQKLSEANELISRAEKVFEINELVAYTAGFRTVSSSVKERHEESVNFAKIAKSMVQPIINGKSASFQEERDARNCLRRINYLMEKIDNVKK